MYMTNKINKWFLSLLITIIETNVYAYDFEADGFCFNITSQNEKTVELTFNYNEPYKGDITIPTSVTYGNDIYKVICIGDSAFYNCIGLTSISIGNSVISIGADAFNNCTGLTSISIPDNVTFIGIRAFCGCSGLASAIIGNGVSSIEWATFGHCTNLSSINLGNNIQSIGFVAFLSCKSLTTITLPKSLIDIGNSAFYKCENLTSIVIPSYVKHIDTGVFSGCTALESISVDSENTVFDSRNNCNAIIETETNTLISGCKNTMIPNGVITIGNSAFAECNGLTSITIPNSVSSIDFLAFNACSYLASITIPESVKVIAKKAFGGCKNLTDVFCYAEIVPDTHMFAYQESNIKNATLHVPNSSIDNYKSTNPWYKFKEIVALTEKELNISVAKDDLETELLRYNLDGHLISNSRKGVNIIRTKDGKTKKVVLK